MSEILVDTNILIYSMDVSSNYHQISNLILLNENDTIFTTSKNLTEFLTVVTRAPQYLMSSTDALTAIKELSKNISILYPTKDSFELLEGLLKKYNSITGLKNHDLEITSIALSNNIKKIATANLKDFISMKEIELIGLGA